METLSLEIAVEEMKNIFYVAYGCQENYVFGKKNLCCAFLDEEVFRAKKSGSGFVMHFDCKLCVPRFSIRQSKINRSQAQRLNS